MGKHKSRSLFLALAYRKNDPTTRSGDSSSLLHCGVKCRGDHRSPHTPPLCLRVGFVTDFARFWLFSRDTEHFYRAPVWVTSIPGVPTTPPQATCDPGCHICDPNLISPSADGGSYTLTLPRRRKHTTDLSKQLHSTTDCCRSQERENRP